MLFLVVAVLTGCAPPSQPASCPVPNYEARRQRQALEQALRNLEKTVVALDTMGHSADAMFERLGVRTETQQRLRDARWQAEELRRLLRELESLR